MKKIEIQTFMKDELIDITELISETLNEDDSGIVVIYVPHTSAAVMINEGADPDVQTDMINFFKALVPWNNPNFKHTEGNSAAHIKAAMVGNNQTIIVDEGTLQLGTWERVFFCEFDGPRNRKIWIKAIQEK